MRVLAYRGADHSFAFGKQRGGDGRVGDNRRGWLGGLEKRKRVQNVYLFAFSTNKYREKYSDPSLETDTILHQSILHLSYECY